MTAMLPNTSMMPRYAYQALRSLAGRIEVTVLLALVAGPLTTVAVGPGTEGYFTNLRITPK